MNVREAYNSWSKTYDKVENRTRDLEAKALRECIITDKPLDILEIGCGTGKNTAFLQTRAAHLISVDFSAEMLAAAKAKISAENVEFRQFDVRGEWNFSEHSFDLITCSLILEHIENIDYIFQQAGKALRQNGLLYIGELHPFKQYQGSKARFDTGSEIFELECFVHHISEFFETALKNNFRVVELREWFDNDDKTAVPRLLTILFINNYSKDNHSSSRGLDDRQICD